MSDVKECECPMRPDPSVCGAYTRDAVEDAARRWDADHGNHAWAKAREALMQEIGPKVDAIMRGKGHIEWRMLMRALAILCALVLVSLPDRARAAAPPVGPGTTIPGAPVDMSKAMVEAAVELAKTVVSNYGERHGYPVGAKVDDRDTQCMLYFGLAGSINHALSLTPSGSYAANGLNKAAKWAQKGIDDWCGPKFGAMNRGFLMMNDAVADRFTQRAGLREALQGIAAAGIVVGAAVESGAPVLAPGALLPPLVVQPEDVRPALLKAPTGREAL